MRFLFLVLMLGFLSGCLLQTREDVQQQDEEKQMKEQVSNIQRTKADNEQRITDLQTDLRALSGRVDVVEHNGQGAEQGNKAEIENLKKLIVALGDRLKLVEQHMDATEQKLMAAIQAVSVATQQPAPQQAAAADNGKEEAKGKKSDSPLADADGLLGGKEYKSAIVQYHAYLEKRPKGAHAAEATYKIAYCFSEMGMKKDAKEFYQETIESFPGTSYAKKAKVKLAQIK